MPNKIQISGYTQQILFDFDTESTTSRSLSTSDIGYYIRCTNASPITITVPTDANAGWDNSAEMMFEQAGAGQITISAASGVTVNSSETLKSSKQYSVMGIKRVGANTWTLFGEREAS